MTIIENELKNENIPDGDQERHQYFRPKQAAHYTGLSESTLAKLRMRHRRAEGPSFLKINGCIIYKREDLDDWMCSFSVNDYCSS